MRVAVVGGGITGLAAAWELVNEGEPDIRVTVFEQADRVGGKLRTHRERGLTIECGPDSFLARKPEAVALCRELGLASRLVETGLAAGKTFLAHGGRLYRFPAGGSYMGMPVTDEALASAELLSEAGRQRALLDLALPDGSPEDGADESVGALLRRRVGDELVDRYGEAVMSGIYGASLDRLSLLATFPELREAERAHGSLLRGLRERLRQAREASGDGKPIAMQAVGGQEKRGASVSGASAFLSLEEGLESLVAALSRALCARGVNIRLRTSVTGIAQANAKATHSTPDPDRPENTGLSWRLRAEGGGRTFEESYDAVICTTPSFAAAPLFSSWPDIRGILAGIRYASVATAAFFFDGRDLPAPDGAGFVVPRVEPHAISACTWLTSKWPHAGDGRTTVLRCFLGRDGEEEMMAAPDARVVRLALADLKTLMGVDARLLQEAVITRWGHSMPQYDVGHLQRLVQLERRLREDCPGIWYTGAACRGVGIPDCIRQGRAAAGAALEYMRAAHAGT